MLTFSEYEVHKTLKDLAQKTFPDKEIKGFIVKFDYKKQLKTKHGHYVRKKGEAPVISIFNFDRPHNHIIATTIHELAHHCEYSFTGDTGHSENFYRIYKQLLEQAHKDTTINLDEAKTQDDARDIEMLEKKVGALRYQEVNSEAVIVKINNYDQREMLKADGYKFSPTEKLWVKEYATQEEATDEIQGYTDIDESNISVVNKSENAIESTCYVIFGKDCFDVKDKVKEFGARFDKKLGWYKKIKLSEKQHVQAFSASIGLEKIRYSNSVKLTRG